MGKDKELIKRSIGRVGPGCSGSLLPSGDRLPVTPDPVSPLHSRAQKVLDAPGLSQEC